MSNKIELIKTTPKAELHLHLRGAIPVSVFTSLLNKYTSNSIPDRVKDIFSKYNNILPFLKNKQWSENEVSKLFVFNDFENFLHTYWFTSFFVKEREDLRKLIKGVTEDLIKQNVVYSEITISVREYLDQGLTLEDIKFSIEETLEFKDIKIMWIVDLVKDFGVESAERLIKEIIKLDIKNLIGITLGGNEIKFPLHMFKGVYETAKEKGLRLSVHAGEACGPENIWAAIKKLKSDRIGHGVRAIEDDSLVDYLAENQIPLEVCVTSNIKTGVYPSYEEHPIKKLYDRGVAITLNSDDPTFFNTNLNNELMLLYELGFSQEEILNIIKNGFKYSFENKTGF